MIERVNWEDIEKFVTEIDNLHKEKHFTGVYGLARGGLIPAIMISYKLSIPLLQAPCRGCLIVDDIADTGRSLSHYILGRTNDIKYFIATIYYSHQSIVRPDYYMKEKEDNKWVVFPWEKIVSDTEIIKS